MFYLQHLDGALVWQLISVFLSIVVERFEEEMKFDWYANEAFSL